MVNDADDTKLTFEQNKSSSKVGVPLAIEVIDVREYSYGSKFPMPHVSLKIYNLTLQTIFKIIQGTEKESDMKFLTSVFFMI